MVKPQARCPKKPLTQTPLSNLTETWWGAGGRGRETNWEEEGRGQQEWEGQEGERDKYNLKYTYENVIINHYHVTYIYILMKNRKYILFFKSPFTFHSSERLTPWDRMQ